MPPDALKREIKPVLDLMAHAPVSIDRRPSVDFLRGKKREGTDGAAQPEKLPHFIVWDQRRDGLHSVPSTVGVPQRVA